MEQIKITVALIIAILLQWTLRNVTYAALQRNSINALLYGTISGLAVDALSGGLLGGNAFSTTLVAYIISEVARRVYLDNLLLRIPVIAGACLVERLVFFGMHKILGQTPSGSPVVIIAYTLIGTTIIGTVIFVILESFFSEKVQKNKREFFAPQRDTRRRNPIRLGRRRG